MPRDLNVTRGWTNEEKTCTRKSRYATRRKALHAVEKAWQERRWVAEVYRCPFCEGWHLTTMLTRNRNRKDKDRGVVRRNDHRVPGIGGDLPPEAPTGA